MAVGKTFAVKAGYIFRFQDRLVRPTSDIELEIVPLEEAHYEMLTPHERSMKAGRAALVRALAQKAESTTTAQTSD